MALRRIVTGGQTGVDRGALDAALRNGFPCGGWCPEGRRAEDGCIDPHYPLTELEGASYAERTTQNVIDSDGAVIICFVALAGGTEQTRIDCEKHNKPHLLIDGTTIAPDCAAKLMSEFIVEHRIEALNVAGPRESEARQAYNYTYNAISALLNEQPATTAKS